MAGRADAGDADRRLVGIGLQPGDQPLEIVRRQALLADDQQRLAADLDDRLEILQQIELQRVEAAGQHMRGRGADAERVAVGGRAHRAADAEAAGRASDIFDHHGLAENRSHLLGQKARQRVGGAAGGERHDHGDRACRIGLGRGGADRGKTEQDRGQNRQQSTHAALRCAFPDVPMSPYSVPAALGRAVPAPLENLPTLFTIPSRCL